MLCRSPTYPLWGTTAPAVGVAGQVVALWTYGNASEVFSVGTFTETNLPVDVDPPIASGSFASAWADLYVIGKRGDRFGWYVPQGYSAYIQLALANNVVGTAQAEVSWVPLSDDSDTDVFTTSLSVSSSGTAFNFGGVGGGFMFLDGLRCLTVASATSLVGIQAGFSTTSSVLSRFPLFTPTEFSTAPLVYRATRVTACAALFSNVSQVLNKEGTVDAARLNSKTGALLSGTGSRISTTHPKDRYFGPLEHGLYTYTMPDAESEQFVDHVWDVDNTANGNVPNFVITTPKPVFVLDNIGYKNSIMFSDLDPSSTTTLAVTLAIHLEFRSSSMLFPVGFSTVPLEEYHKVQMALAQLGCFFENPVHWAMIGSAVRAAVAKIAPVVAPYARAALVHGGQMLLNAAAKKLGSQMGTQATLAKPKTKAPAPRAKRNGLQKAKKVVSRPTRR